MNDRNKISFIVLYIIVLISIINCNNVLGQKKIQNQKDFSESQVKSTLKQFYESYTSEYFNTQTNNWQEKIDSIRNIYCTKKLIEFIDRKFGDNELDYEPFTHAQMFNIETLRTMNIQKDIKKNNIYYVSFIWTYSKKQVTIKLGVVKENSNYKVDHIYLEYFKEESIDKD